MTIRWKPFLSSLVCIGLGFLSFTSVVVAEDTNAYQNGKQLLDKTETLHQEVVTLHESINAEIERLREEIRLQEELERQAEQQAEQQRQAMRQRVSNQGWLTWDVREPSGLTAEQLNHLLETTGLNGLGESYAIAEATYHVNALVLIGISALESSWGTSALAQERNNLFGFKAYDTNVDAASYFPTKHDAILTVAAHLSNQYLQEDGPYFNGYTLTAMNERYASDMDWSVKIASIIAKLMEQVAG